MAKVFISSPRGAEDVARELSEALRDREVSTWLSADNLELGDEIGRRLKAEVAEADVYVIVVSHSTGGSLDVWFDLEQDIERRAILEAIFRYPNKKVIPVLIDASPSRIWRNWKGIKADRKPFNAAEVADQISAVLTKPGDNRAVLSIEDQRKRRERIDAIAQNAEKIRIAETSEKH